MTGVVLEEVSRVYPGGVRAVNQLNLEVQAGEILVLLGPSGCGKTTTLRLIAGLEQASSGVIRIAGRVANQLPPRERDVAMVFQNPALYPHLTVRQNLAFGLHLRYGESWLRQIIRRAGRLSRRPQLAERRGWIDRQVEDVARALKLEELLGRLPRQLSGGERQRVAVGRAMVRQPTAFLFDEPLSNLDSQLRSEVRRQIKSLRNSNRAAMIYVTHDQLEAMALADRIAVMRHGEILQEGTPQQLYDDPSCQFVASFIGQPPMNLVAGELVFEKGRWEFKTHGWSVALDSQWVPTLPADHPRTVVLGLRSENIGMDSLEAPATGGTMVAARARSMEPQGDRIQVDFELLGEVETNHSAPVFRAKLPADRRLATGDRVWLKLDLARARWFDSRTGERLAK